jgi:Flp pilus assembly pilin Flp
MDKRIRRMLRRLVVDEEAPAMAEYGLLILFIALAVAAAAVVLGVGVSTLFSAAGSAFSNATVPTIP